MNMKVTILTPVIIYGQEYLGEGFILVDCKKSAHRKSGIEAELTTETGGTILTCASNIKLTNWVD